MLLPAGAALLIGLDAALVLLGLPAPWQSQRAADHHGVLMVLGFLGTLVAAERAVALRQAWAAAGPALLAAGALGALVAPRPLAGAALSAGAAAAVATYAALWRRAGSAELAVQGLGAVLALGAALLWTGGVPVPRLLPWLVGFVVLTIAGERAELGRIGAPALPGRVLLGSGALAAGVVAATLWPAFGTSVLGAVLLALVAVLVRDDAARRTVTSTGLPRYVAWCLLTGYAWLAVAAGAWLVAGASDAVYDATVHAVFLGFALAMVMGHAPVILPAVLGVRLPYRTAMYGPLVLLHGSLLVRVVLGDVRGWQGGLVTGGALNVAALLGFVAVAVGSVVLERRAPGVPEPVGRAA